jgi:hypothetical protein
MDTITVNYVVKGPQRQVWRFPANRVYILLLALLAIAEIASVVVLCVRYPTNDPAFWADCALEAAGDAALSCLVIAVMFYGDSFYPNRRVTLSPNGEVVVEGTNSRGSSTGYRFVCGAYEKDEGYYLLYSTNAKGRRRGVCLPDEVITPEVLSLLSQFPERRYRTFKRS